MIKPASADCNLRCDYCFYIDHLKETSNPPRMSDEILDLLVKKYMKTNQNSNYSFGWQGGEPTMMGLNFFQKVVKLQQKYGPPGAIVSNGLQTNGTIITEEMAKFFREYKFLLGVSLDGPEYLHDYYRKTIINKSTHHLVLRGIENLKKYNVEFNILVLVNNKTVKKAKEIFQYLKEKGFYYHQYIPCVEYDENNKPYPYSITGEEWGIFLCELFDEWKKEDARRISVRLFDTVLEYLIYGRYNVCIMDKDCCQYFVVEYDGGVYPCDFFVKKDLYLGNLKTNSWEDFLNSPIYLQFGRLKALWNKECNLCPFLDFCHGDCQKNRIGGGVSPRTLSILCKGWKRFYAHALPHFENLSNKIIIERKIKPSVPVKVKKFGRNDLCPCGSGKKYKNCCMK